MIAIVTATLDWPTAQGCVLTWLQQARDGVALYIVGQQTGTDIAEPGWRDIASLPNLQMQGYMTPEILGVVPAFAIGVAKALEDGHEIIACFHDDLEIHDAGWDTDVVRWFRTNPYTGLVGFGGGVGLGDVDIYRKPYHPMQLARRNFVSNMRDATAHGGRVLVPMRVACLDGFSQIGRREYWEGRPFPAMGISGDYLQTNLFQQMAEWGIVHHAYDAALGAFAKRLGWDVWMLPVACHHYGGRTAVGNPDYQAWARSQSHRWDGTDEGHTGDPGFWHRSHQIVYEQFRDVLPID